MTDYRSRVVDFELAWRMTTTGAVLIDGPKAVGKTETASQLARTVIRMDTDRSARAALDLNPSQLFDSATPILFDEWQETPDLWNLVRRAVDDRGEKGLFLLTGSARPRDDLRVHSGAGRIGRLRMRPMSLFETGHSTGAVSLAALLQGADPSGSAAELTAPEVIERMVIGGWPALLGQGEREARAWVADYLRTVADVDVPEMGPRRNPGNIMRLFAALARATGSPAKGTTLAAEIGGQRGPIATETLSNYLDALDRLMLIEPLPAWRPHMRSRTRLRTTPVQHFVDPSIGIAALGIGSRELLGDLEGTGLHFESLVLRDLRTYSQSLGATLSSWRDSQSGAEVDVVMELPDGSWAAFEIKMGEAAAETAASSLLHFAAKIDEDRHGKPAALAVITAGRYTYRRADGVLVVPITALGP